MGVQGEGRGDFWKLQKADKYFHSFLYPASNTDNLFFSFQNNSGEQMHLHTNAHEEHDAEGEEIEINSMFIWARSSHQTSQTLGILASFPDSFIRHCGSELSRSSNAAGSQRPAHPWRSNILSCQGSGKGTQAAPTQQRWKGR